MLSLSLTHKDAHTYPCPCRCVCPSLVCMSKSFRRAPSMPCPKLHEERYERKCGARIQIFGHQCTDSNIHKNKNALLYARACARTHTPSLYEGACSSLVRSSRIFLHVIKVSFRISLSSPPLPPAVPDGRINIALRRFIPSDARFCKKGEEQAETLCFRKQLCVYLHARLHVCTHDRECARTRTIVGIRMHVSTCTLVQETCT